MYDGQKKKKKKKWFEDQRVDEVSIKNCKGMHTTRNVTLMQLSGGGYIADTPGSNKKLLKVTKQSLPLCFPEVCVCVPFFFCLCPFSHIDCDYTFLNYFLRYGK